MWRQRKRRNNSAPAPVPVPVPVPVNQPMKKKLKTKANPEPSDSDSGSFSPNKLNQLLEPYSKDQLINLISNFSVADSSLYSCICSAAEADVTHRKIFVHGLSWDSTRETLLEAFGQYGEIEECSAVLDRATGKCKGYVLQD
uniref:RRM domain-containing protein n=1 Tax=Kalanchoe fedtschenkoi TaxID=63787 RepID=A0A7N0U125_KALFE